MERRCGMACLDRCGRRGARPAGCTRAVPLMATGATFRRIWSAWRATL